MNTPLLAAIYCIVYALGSVNFSLLASRVMKSGDLRLHGSGNPGATNLLRTAGARVAVPVLILDIFRAFAVVYFTKQFSFNTYWPAIAIPLLIGNLFPLFHGFKGGKGVATSVGILLAIDPVSFLFGAAAALVVLGFTRMVSTMSLTLLIATAVAMFVIDGLRPEFILSSLLCASALVTHRENIQRIVRGTERRI